MSVVNEEKSWLEWVVFGVSLLLIVGVVGYLIADGVKDEGRPPDLRITLGKPQKSAHGFVVPVTVTNLGDKTAEAVELEVRSSSASQPETANLTYEFLASGEVRQGWVGFLDSPSETMVARVVGYHSE